jgi:predicted DNA-binding protein
MFSAIFGVSRRSSLLNLIRKLSKSDANKIKEITEHFINPMKEAIGECR